MANLFSHEYGKVNDFVGKLAAAGLTAEMIEEVRKNPTLAEAMVKALKAQPAPTLTSDLSGLFTKPEDQLKRVREWNLERGWGVSDEVFAEAEKSIPAVPEDDLVAVVLVPYLTEVRKKDKIVMTGVERTFQELWALAKAEQQANWRWDGYDKAGPERLRLLKGIEHTPGLRWEVIDLGANRNRKPEDVRNAKRSPHAGILAAAALHPEWVRAMDGENVPYVWLPGYEVNVPGGGAWQDVPDLGFYRGGRGVRLYCGWYYDCFPSWAVPSFRE